MAADYVIKSISLIDFIYIAGISNSSSNSLPNQISLKSKLHSGLLRSQLHAGICAYAVDCRCRATSYCAETPVGCLSGDPQNLQGNVIGPATLARPLYQGQAGFNRGELADNI